MSVDKTRLIFFALKYLFNEDIDQFAINMVLKESIFVTQSISPHFWHMCDDSDIIVSIMAGGHLTKIHDYKCSWCLVSKTNTVQCTIAFAPLTRCCCTPHMPETFE